MAGGDLGEPCELVLCKLEGLMSDSFLWTVSTGHSTAVPVHAHHHFSHSASAAILQPPQPGSPAIALTPDIDSSHSSSSSDDQHVPSKSQLSPTNAQHNRCSVMPDLGAKKDTFNPYSEFVLLTRVSTAPHDAMPAKGKGDHARWSDNKLSRMGLSTANGWQPPSSAPLPPVNNHHKSHFGSFKSIVQSLKGKL